MNAELIEAAKAAGRMNAEAEVESWIDQNGDMSRAGEWVRGNLQGVVPAGLNAEQAEEFVNVAEDAAELVWNAARN